jgi:diguanylate cyclase (GGDEF)-like protein/PAS domain S-box-containing protein
MDEKLNPRDLILENERLREELHGVTQNRNDLLIYKQQLDAIFDNAPFEVCLKDREGRYIRVNKQYEKIFGVKNENLVGMLPADTHNPKLAASSRDDDLAVLNSGKAKWRGEITKLVNEKPHTLSTIKFPVFNTDGEVDGLGAIVTDISENEATKEKLQKSNILFSQAAKLGKLGHWEWDEIASRYIFCSEQYASIFGMTVEQLVEKVKSLEEDHQEFVCEEDLERYQQVIHAATENNQGWDIKYSYYNKVGKRMYLHEICEPVLDDHGVMIKTVGIVQDITETTQLEQELKQNHAFFQKAESIGNMGHFCWDRKGDKLISCSDQFAHMYGMSVPEALEYFISNETITSAIHPDDKELVRLANYDTNGKLKGSDVEYRIIDSSGNTRHLHVRSELVLDNYDAPSHTFGTVQDITERKKTEEKLQESNERLEIEIKDRKNTETELRASQKQLKSACDLAKLGYWEWDLIRDCSTYYSNDLYDILDIDPGTIVDGELAGSEDRKHIHPDDLELYYSVTKFSGGKADRFDIEYRAIRRNGDITFLREIGQAIRNDSGEITGSIGIILDNTDRIQVGATLRQSENRLRSLVSSSPVCIQEIDLDGKLVSMNPSGLKMMGVENESEIIGLNYLDIPILEDRERVSTLMDSAKRGLGSIFEFSTAGVNGALHLLCSLEPINDEDGNIVRLMGVTQDITARKKVEEKLSYQASHDALTGLINRPEFEQRTEHLLSTIQSDKTEHAMCFLDLDQFKVINDTCGHVAGDELLRQLGMLLQNTVRKRDTLARLGGDEFGVLMEHCGLDQAHRVADEIFDAINEYQFFWEGESFRIGVSIGLVAITETTGNYTDLFKQADAACYLAKGLGRNRIHVYHPDDVELSIRQGEMQWVRRINQAVDEDRFCLYAQPIVSLNNDDLKHYELLVRMLNEEGEVIPPGAFLPAAERYNLIEKIDAWVVQHAISLMIAHSAFVAQVNFISINLSGQSVANAQFMPMVIALISESNIDARKICFEVTETAAISNLSAANTFITALKDLGCRFALDDFGSGLSSFGYLKNLPVDYLKIDGMFVKDIVDDPIDKAMVKSINDIGHVMGMKTIAEFVENDAIMEQLIEVGVDYAQGYGLGKPEPFNDVISQFDNV